MVVLEFYGMGLKEHIFFELFARQSRLHTGLTTSHREPLAVAISAVSAVSFSPTLGTQKIPTARQLAAANPCRYRNLK
jgi:hypothetical protein